MVSISSMLVVSLHRTIRHYSANACLLPLCQLHGAAVTTVEGIGSTKTRIHPVQVSGRVFPPGPNKCTIGKPLPHESGFFCKQERIAKAHGSQCGFCTPGMVMSIYALLRNRPQPTMEDITQALDGLLFCVSSVPGCFESFPFVEGESDPPVQK